MEDEDYSDLMKGLRKLYVELTGAAVRAHCLYKLVKESDRGSKDFFKHPWKLIPSAREVIGKKRISVEELLALWTPEWKAEGRLSANGSTVKLPAKHAELLKLAPETDINVYELSNHICTLFESAD